MKFSEIWYVDASQQNEMLQKIFFWISAFFGRFLTKKQPKLTQRWRKLAKSKPFDEIFWNLVRSCFPTTKNATKKDFSYFGLFWPFLTKNKPKKNWQNPNRFIKFSEIWYLDASQQKNATIFFFLIPAFFGRFLTKNQPKLTKNDENGQNVNRLMKFSEIWYVDATHQKKATNNFFLFWPFLAVF